MNRKKWQEHICSTVSVSLKSANQVTNTVHTHTRTHAQIKTPGILDQGRRTELKSGPAKLTSGFNWLGLTVLLHRICIEENSRTARVTPMYYICYVDFVKCWFYKINIRQNRHNIYILNKYNTLIAIYWLTTLNILLGSHK